MSYLNLQLTAALILTLAAAAFDLRSGRIPNWLSATGAVLGLLAHVGAGLGEGWPAALRGLVGAFVAAACCALLPAILLFARGIGGGDVKLFIAIGALVGVRIGLEVQLFVFTLAPLFLFGLLAYEGVLWRTLSVSATTMASIALRRPARHVLPVELQRSFKFAPVISAGVALALGLHWSRP